MATSDADLGLAAASELIEQLGGRLALSGEPASGIRVELAMPLVAFAEEGGRG